MTCVVLKGGVSIDASVWRFPLGLGERGVRPPVAAATRSFGPGAARLARPRADREGRRATLAARLDAPSAFATTGDPEPRRP